MSHSCFLRTEVIDALAIGKYYCYNEASNKSDLFCNIPILKT